MRTIRVYAEKVTGSNLFCGCSLTSNVTVNGSILSRHSLINKLLALANWCGRKLDIVLWGKRRRATLHHPVVNYFPITAPPESFTPYIVHGNSQPENNGSFIDWPRQKTINTRGLYTRIIKNLTYGLAACCNYYKYPFHYIPIWQFIKNYMLGCYIKCRHIGTTHVFHPTGFK